MDANAQLRTYVMDGSQEAFRALVGQYAGLIYSAARRQVNDPHLAEDVTQAVFVILAQKAAAIPVDRPLGAWLLRTTAYVSANARRQRIQREFHERKAAEMTRLNQNEHASEPNDSDWSGLSPILDVAIDRLAQADREALVLRYFEKLSLVQVGAALGITEAAAAKRVSRAIQKLRKRLAGQGVAFSTTSLAVMLLDNTVMPPPPGLISTLNSGVAPAASAVSLAKGALIVTTSTKLKIAAASLILLLGGSTVAIVTLAPPRASGALEKQVVVAPATVPAPQLTESSMATVYFTDGTAVSLIGVAQTLGGSQNWWGYDGKPVPDPSFPNIQERRRSSQDPSAREMVFQIDGQKIEEKNVSVRPAANSGLSMRAATRYGAMYKTEGSLREGVSTVDLSVSVAHGPWLEHTIWQKGADGRPLVLDGAFAQVSSIEQKGNEVLITIPYQRAGGSQDDAERVEVVLSDGRRLEDSGSMGEQGKQILHFICRSEELAKIILSTRPYERITIANVPIFMSGATEIEPRTTAEARTPAHLR